MRIRGITRNVVILGWVSFFTDLASEMLYPIIPLFLASTLGASAAVIGLIEGVAEGISSGLRWLGGALSDRYRSRKPFVVAGYSISAFSKPVMGLAAFALGWPLLLIGRSMDRLGKSIRTSARDALIADSTDPMHRGVAFGFHRAMDTAGAILGPLIALLILGIWVGFPTVFSARWGGAGFATSLANLPLAWLFFIGLLPGLASVFLAVSGIRDMPHDPNRAGPPSIFQSFPAPFWQLIIANALFSFGNSSDAFLILRSSEIGLSFGHVILAFALYNTVYALASAPFGRLSDRIGRKPVIAAGWIMYAAVYLGFALTRSPLAPWILLGAYGLYQALAEGVTKAMVSDVVGADQRAGAIGLFYTVSGFGQFAASLIVGSVWNIRLFDSRLSLPFALGALFALLAVPVIATVKTRQPALE